MCSDVVIQVENLSKCYQIYNKPTDRLKQFLYPSIKRVVGKPVHNYYQDFWALNNINFVIPKGETVGVIGKNGSGKSTLLQIICGTLTPTAGIVNTQGRIGALLELGSGFNPEFTGRENVYLNASVLGLTKDQIEAKLDDILSFADIGAFIDQPVKKYSSGMSVRLAFAVQAQIEPDILIVDEALAVGDARFQAKCFSRLQKLKEGGTSILLVTHSSEQIVQHCSYALLLNNGQQVAEGNPKLVVNQYHDILFGKTSPTLSVETNKQIAKQVQSEHVVEVSKTHNQTALYPLSTKEDIYHTHPGYNEHEYRWGDAKGKIIDYVLICNDEVYPHAVPTGSYLTIFANILFIENIYFPILGFNVKTKEGLVVHRSNTDINKSPEAIHFKNYGQAGSVVQVKITFQMSLAAGDYFLTMGLASPQESGPEPHDRRFDGIHLVVEPTPHFNGLADLDAQFMQIKILEN
jgi:lipopolysaccharide transport system ATP-binding protein